MKPGTAQSINFMASCIASSSVNGTIFDNCSGDAAGRLIQRNIRLTKKSGTANLYELSQKTKAGIGLLNDAAQPLSCGFFVPNAQLSIMAGWVEQPSGWPVASPVDQLRSVRLPMIGLVWRRVYNPFRDAIMKINTQNPPKTQGKFNPRFDLFKLHNGVKTLICRGISLEQAKGLLPESPSYRLKFTGLVNGGAA